MLFPPAQGFPGFEAPVWRKSGAEPCKRHLRKAAHLRPAGAQRRGLNTLSFVDRYQFPVLLNPVFQKNERTGFQCFQTGGCPALNESETRSFSDRWNLLPADH
jgi:hypothetical protein